jgi:hypothetical protein
MVKKAECIEPNEGNEYSVKESLKVGNGGDDKVD